MGPTGTSAVDPVICKTTGQVVHQLNRKIFALGRRSAGHRLAMKSVLNTPFLLDTLRMDPNEDLWHLDPPFDIVSPNDLLYTPPYQHKECSLL